jgi:hypothetical protein
MIQLAQPVTQQITEFEVISFTESKKPLPRVVAEIRTNLGPRTLLLWRGEEVAAAGQYGDADIEARVTTLLSTL